MDICGAGEKIIMEELKSERLIIRGFKKEDWKDLYEYFSDEEWR